MSDLRQSMSLWRGGALMLNIVLGAGLLVLPGLAIRQAGDFAFLAWVACAAAALPLLMVFMALGRRFPHAGGIAHYADLAFGPAFYLVASYLFLGAVAIGLPSIALTGGHYLAAAFGGPVHLYAFGIVLFAGLGNLGSVELSGRWNQILAYLLLGFLIAIALVAWLFIPPADPQPVFFPTTIMADWLRLMAPFMMIFFAFTGWEVAANLAEDFRRPRRDFPLAMALSFALATALYLAMAYIAQSRDLLGAFASPFVALFGARFGAMGGGLIAAIAGALILANLSSAFWGVSRAIFALSREGRAPRLFLRLRSGQPIAAMIAILVTLSLVLTGDALGWVTIDRLLALAGQNFFLLYGMAALALVSLAPRRLEKALGLFAAALVFALALAQGGSLLYPASLTLLALAVYWRGSAKRAATPPMAAVSAEEIARS